MITLLSVKQHSIKKAAGHSFAAFHLSKLFTENISGPLQKIQELKQGKVADLLT